MVSLLLIDTASYDKNKKSGRFYYIMKYCLNKYQTTLLHYQTEKKGQETDKTNGLLRTVSVNLLFNQLTRRSESLHELMYQLFFTFLQPLYTVFRAYSRLEKSDVCIAEGVWGGLIGISLKKLGKVNRVVYEDMDYFPYFWKNYFFQRALFIIEKYVVTRADLLVCVNHSLRNLRKAQGAKRIIVVPNGVDYTFFLKAQSKKQHPPTLIFVGWLQEYQGIDFSIRCMPEMMDTFGNLRYLILGEGSFENNLRELIKELHLEKNVFLLGQKKHESIPDYFAESDIAIAARRPTLLTMFASPYKIPEYLAAGLPVIISKTNSDPADSFKGTISVVYNSKDLVTVIVDLLSNRDKYRELSLEATKAAGELDWNGLLEREFLEISMMLRSEK